MMVGVTNNDQSCHNFIEVSEPLMSKWANHRDEHEESSREDKGNWSAGMETEDEVRKLTSAARLRGKSSAISLTTRSLSSGGRLPNPGNLAKFFARTGKHKSVREGLKKRFGKGWE